MLGLWDDLVDARTGIIQNIGELPRDDDDPEFFHYVSKACDTTQFSGLRNFGENGGASVSRYAAIAKAMGEAVERYCSAIYQPSELLIATYKELGEVALHPTLLSLYRSDQFGGMGFPWRSLTEDSVAHWTSGRSLLTGRDVLIPAAMVYLPFHYFPPRNSTPFVQPISTGLACGCSFESAALTGLCEVVERDAFTITWQARLSRRRIRPESLSKFGADLLRRFADVQLDVQLVDITTDIGIPTIMSIAVGDVSSSPAIAVAAATHSSPEVAMVKCLEELAHTRKYAKQLMEYTPPVEVDMATSHANVRDQKDHLRFYCPQNSKAFAEFAWGSQEMCDLSDIPDISKEDEKEELKVLVQTLARADLEAFACDLTTPDIASLGLRVVRVVVPGAHPLFMGHHNRALGVQRLYEVPVKLGFRGPQPQELDNPYPHPFP